MSIKNQIKVIARVNKSVVSMEGKYPQNTGAAIELKKLNLSLTQLENYLSNLDQLKPNFNTNEINPHIEAINLHLDILKGELNEKDYKKLSNGITVIKTILKFHPTKYSYFTFMIAWVFEMMYFV